MKSTYTEIDSRRYTCTSERVPGRKNPVTGTTYLGVVDPVTGEVVLKRRRDSDELRLFDRGFKVRDLGDVLIADAYARRLGRMVSEALKTIVPGACEEFFRSRIDRCEEAFELYRSHRVLFSQLGTVMDSLMRRWGVEDGPRTYRTCIS